jgi:hypothetical protein
LTSVLKFLYCLYINQGVGLRPRRWRSCAISGPERWQRVPVLVLRVQYRLKLPDAVPLASALQIGAVALVTHDRDFSAVQGLPVLMGA